MKVGDLVRIIDVPDVMGTVLEVDHSEYDRSFFGTIPTARLRVLWTDKSPGIYSPLRGVMYQSVSWVTEDMLEVISEDQTG